MSLARDVLEREEHFRKKVIHPPYTNNTVLLFAESRKSSNDGRDYEPEGDEHRRMYSNHPNQHFTQIHLPPNFVSMPRLPGPSQLASSNPNLDQRLPLDPSAYPPPRTTIHPVFPPSSVQNHFPFTPTQLQMVSHLQLPSGTLYTLNLKTLRLTWSCRCPWKICRTYTSHVSETDHVDITPAYHYNADSARFKQFSDRNGKKRVED